MNTLRSKFISEVIKKDDSENAIYLALSITNILFLSYGDRLKYDSLLEAIEGKDLTLDEVITKHYQGKIRVLCRYIDETEKATFDIEYI